ncbi:MAG: hypothetical protein HY695_19145 [Deltaproteobacteria bacterium]|nr:hypothetical protein [Deltaproteobacteria bacterium]
MKHARMPRDEYFEEIVETLKSVPKRRLRIVRDFIGALAELSLGDTDGTKSKRRGLKSLVKTPFCGMWEKRTDIDNGRSYARELRRVLEKRGDRT